MQSVIGRLPASYLELLRLGNGGEVGLAVPPYTLCPDSAESAIAYWNSGTCTAQNGFVFGGNVGGALLALDMREHVFGTVVCFDPIDPGGTGGEGDVIVSTFAQKYT